VQKALRCLRYQHELILNSVSDGVHSIDLEGNFVFVNPRAAELLGYTVEELLGESAHETIHHHHADGSDYALELCPIHNGLRDGTRRRVTNDIFWRKNGTSLRVEYIYAPIAHDGFVSGSVIIFRDVSGEVLADARLRLQAEQYRLLFETNPSPMWVFDMQTLRILAVNAAAIAQYGYAREEFLDLTPNDLHRNEDDSVLFKAVTIPDSPVRFAGQFTHFRKDGSGLLVEIYSNFITWEDAAARIITAIDVTNR
jgi:PAS domain S-box-containing protein